MAHTVKLVAKSRSGNGSKESKKIRKTGNIPGVVYGHKEKPVSISTAHEDLFKAVKQGVRLVDLETDGKVEKALIREVQWDYLGNDLIHVDFSRVSADEKIHITVPVEMRGTAPGVLSGGILDIPMHKVHIECLAINIPDSIRVNVAELQIGGAIHVRELVLPEGVRVLDDADAVVVHVLEKKTEVAAVPGSEEGAANEPEVIKKPKPVAEEEE